LRWTCSRMIHVMSSLNPTSLCFMYCYISHSVRIESPSLHPKEETTCNFFRSSVWSRLYQGSVTKKWLLTHITWLKFDLLPSCVGGGYGLLSLARQHVIFSLSPKGEGWISSLTCLCNETNPETTDQGNFFSFMLKWNTWTRDKAVVRACFDVISQVSDSKLISTRKRKSTTCRPAKRGCPRFTR
jgi:hypothetical protein